ncbi:MAG: PEGA domain-containing protein [Candidatus Portnoybacteria bacterium]|nr:PEGA domain-containing protein [Candidatus Portnoybacteria bacterium]
MTNKTRKIILLTVTLFFILLAPIILLYAWGYSFDWQSKKPVLTGGIYLKSIPKKAEVYINNEPQKEATPTFIERLLPKEYQIRVTKEGFHSWEKTLKVESKIVTEAKNILLIPINLEIKTVNSELILELSEESINIFYIQEPSYILYKTDKNNSFQEQISLTPLSNNYKYEIFTSANEQIVVLDEKNQLYLLNQETKNFELISQNVQGIQFSYDNRKLLYFTPSEIWIYHLEGPGKIEDKKELITRVSQNIKQAIWYKTNEHIIFSIGENIKIVELDNRSDRNIINLIKLKVEKMIYSQKDEKIYLIKGNELFAITLE